MLNVSELFNCFVVDTCLMNWIELNCESKLEEIKKYSYVFPVLIFKHSTRCSISTAALYRLERNWEGCKMSSMKTYLIDLLSFRNVSNKISEEFSIHHESPQVLLIKDGECIYDASHLEIQMDELTQQVFRH